MAIPTQARACAYFNYDQITGRLIFKERPREEFANDATFGSHLKRVGKNAGTINAGGYVKVLIDGTKYSAHHVIWLMMTGEWVSYPEFEIDHKNGNPADNRWGNLRKVTKSGNQHNSSRRANNTSGVHGVNWKPTSGGNSGGWVARIWNGPRHVYLGLYQNLRDAQIARRAAEKALGYTGSDRPPSKIAIAKRARNLEARRGGA
jgi:hypothetical protein